MEMLDNSKTNSGGLTNLIPLTSMAAPSRRDQEYIAKVKIINKELKEQINEVK